MNEKSESKKDDVIRGIIKRVEKMAYLLNPMMKNHAVPQPDAADRIPFKNPAVASGQR